MYNTCHMTLQCNPSEGVYHDLACRGHLYDPSSCCLLKPYQLGLVKMLELMGYVSSQQVQDFVHRDLEKV